MSELKVKVLEAPIFAGVAQDLVLKSNNVNRIVIANTGTISFGATAGSESLRVTPVASSVNYLQVAGSATGNAVQVVAAGSDTNIDLTLTPKGTGGVVFPAGAAGTPSVTTTGDTNTGIWFPAADTIAASTAGTERMRINSSGNVGIGTAAGTTTVSNGLAINNATAANYPGLEIQTAGVTRLYFNANNAESYITSVSTNPLVITTNGSERMRINSSGNVGIGTTTPQAKLAVSNGGAAGLEFFTNYPGGGVGTYIQSYNRSSPGYVNTAYDAADHSFRISGTERMRLDGSGRLLIDRTTEYSDGTIGTPPLQVNGISGNRSAAAFISNTTGSLNIVGFVNPNGTVGTITLTGTSTAYNTSSDYRLKENVAPMTGALAKVSALKPVTYNWKADGSDGQGFIAHELQAVVPDCVTGTKDAVDKDGKPQYQGVDTSFLVATLVSAIQELTARLEVLENK
jgi:hypothetical protein